MRLIVCICSVLVSVVAVAQGPDTYTIKPGMGVLQVIPLEKIYRYPTFQQGLVVFRSGASTLGKLNYNHLFAVIQFINQQGDTLSMAEEPLVKYVAIGKDTFYYDKGYVRTITAGPVKLAERVLFREYIQKPGANYELSSGATSSSTITAMREGKTLGSDVVEQEVVLMKNTLYFIGDRFNVFVPADKRNLLKVYSKQKRQVENYLSANAVDFKKEEDLIKLTAFLVSL